MRYWKWIISNSKINEEEVGKKFFLPFTIVQKYPNESSLISFDWWISYQVRINYFGTQTSRPVSICLARYISRSCTNKHSLVAKSIGTWRYWQRVRSPIQDRGSQNRETLLTQKGKFILSFLNRSSDIWFRSIFNSILYINYTRIIQFEIFFNLIQHTTTITTTYELITNYLQKFLCEQFKILISCWTTRSEIILEQL